MLNPHIPDLGALEMLAAVRDLGSLTAAGTSLGLSQQAVSSRMRSLETQIGSTLLARSPRGSSLTPSGVLVAGWAADVLAAAERLGAGIDSLRSSHALTLTVAASQTVAEHLLPLWLVALHRQQESLGTTPTAVELTVTNSESAAALVRSGRATLGFIETPLLPGGVSTLAVHEDDMVLVVAPTHPWARRRTPISVTELARTALVMREQGSGTREALEHLLAAAGFTELAEPKAQFSTTAAVRSAITAGTAPGVLSALAVRDDLALNRLVAVPVRGLPLRRPLTAVWAQGAKPPAGAAEDLVVVASRPLPGMPLADTGRRPRSTH